VTLCLSNPFVALYANDNDAMIPEIWANEGLAILEENMVMAALVHRDFSDEVAEFGDVVNTRRPGEFGISRKTDADSVTAQDAVTNNVRVPLDQHFYVNFVIKDGEASKSFQDLVDIHLLPGMQTIARSIDRALLGQVHQYLANKVGGLGQLTGSNSKDTMLLAREKLNVNKAFFNGRNLVVSPQAETSMLKNELFLRANEKGDDGTALAEASLGRVLGFDVWMDQNVSNPVVTSAEVATGATDAAEPVGETTIDLTITGYEMNAGEYISIAGNDQPDYITAATTGAGDTTDVTIAEGLVSAVASGAVVTAYKALDVDGAYATGYSKGILVDGYAANKGPQIGQLMAFGTGASRRVYTVIEVTNTTTTTATILLDRPLEVALANNDLGFPGPAGGMNLAFHREALALVSRPLALPAADMGVRAQVGVHNDVSMRVTMQYDISQQGTVVTLDLLAGVAVLDENLGCVMLS
jgi:hypothetical protein